MQRNRREQLISRLFCYNRRFAYSAINSASAIPSEGFLHFGVASSDTSGKSRAQTSIALFLSAVIENSFFHFCGLTSSKGIEYAVKSPCIKPKFSPNENILVTPCPGLAPTCSRQHIAPSALSAALLSIAAYLFPSKVLTWIVPPLSRAIAPFLPGSICRCKFSSANHLLLYRIPCVMPL